jgi:hypothetical protein
MGKTYVYTKRKELVVKRKWHRPLKVYEID